MKDALEKDGWDGDWYRPRLFRRRHAFGSVLSADCRIDSIAQSWAVISGAAEPVRAARAMAAVDKYLVQRDQKLSLLFTPPFDQPVHDPGYIKGYPPGIRENGGQYTHGAVWAALAYAMLGNGDRAHELIAMLNPISHSDSPAAMHRYKVEPYVVAADVYSVTPHVGRAGGPGTRDRRRGSIASRWSGCSGLRKDGEALVLDPLHPARLAGIRDRLSPRHGDLHDIGGEPAGRVPRGALAQARRHDRRRQPHLAGR